MNQEEAKAMGQRFGGGKKAQFRPPLHTREVRF